MASTFQHRHYKAIAAIIAGIDDEHIRAAVAHMFAKGLKGTNPNFDEARFYNAAMGNPSNGKDK